MIKWIESKRKGRKTSNRSSDVMISIIKNGTKRSGEEELAVSIRFYRNAEQSITRTGRLQVGIDDEEERIYFASAEETAEETLGYKLSGRKNTKVIQFKPDDLQDWRSYTGEYKLFQDPLNKLFYIDRSKKEST